jgi:hypothetical protein
MRPAKQTPFKKRLNIPSAVRDDLNNDAFAVDAVDQSVFSNVGLAKLTHP